MLKTLYQKWFGEEDVPVKAQRLKKKLERERFDAVLMKIQWECLIHSKVEQMAWIDACFKENQ